MADRADVVVKNVLKGNVIGDVRVIREHPDGTEITVAPDGEGQIHLPDPDAIIRIDAPKGVDTKECHFKVQSDVDIAVTHSRTHSFWKIQIISNELPPDSPTSVNVNIGIIDPG
ncbi:MAG: hypothetical protein GY757_39380 [bacterium]|nr:hypothetical protein [bacterium]